jgi:signal transduction histidine kinase
MVNAQELALLISLGMLFTFLMGIGIVLLAKKNRKIQELSEELLKEEKDKKDLEKLEVAIATQEAERSQIARLLHDDVGAILSLAQKNMLNIQQKAQDGEIEHKSIALTMEYIQESINQLRKINKGLVPHYLLKFGLE